MAHSNIAIIIKLMKVYEKGEYSDILRGLLNFDQEHDKATRQVPNLE